MNWTTKEITAKDGRAIIWEEMQLPGLIIEVRPLHDKYIVEARWMYEYAPLNGQPLFDTLEEGKAAAVPWLRQLILERFTSLVRALGGRVLDVAVDDALLVYDDGLCPKCNDGKSRIDWSKPSDPVNDLYTCGLHEFSPSDLQGMTDEHHFDPGRILLVHFPEPEPAGGEG